MRRVVVALAVLLVALPVGGWLVLRRQAAVLGEALVRDANALEARRFTAGRMPGNLFDCAGPEADVSPDLSRTLPWTLPEVRAVTDGSAGLNDSMRAELETHRAWLRRVVRCGTLETVGPVPGIGPFADLRHGRRQTMPRLMESLTTLAPLSMREAIERGAPNEALETCSSVLALTTAWLRLEGLESMLPTLGPSRAVLSACREANLRVTAEERAVFQGRLAALRSLAPDYAEVMAVERTQLALRLFGAWLPMELDVQLPDSARLMTKTQRDSKFDRGVLATAALRLYWRKFDAGMRDIEKACALPLKERDVAIVAAQKRLEAPFLRKFLAADPVDPKYEMYAVYMDQLRAALEALGN